MYVRAYVVYTCKYMRMSESTIYGIMLLVTAERAPSCRVVGLAGRASLEGAGISTITPYRCWDLTCHAMPCRSKNCRCPHNMFPKDHMYVHEGLLLSKATRTRISISMRVSEVSCV